MTAFKIAVFGPEQNAIGFWRRFSDGSVAVFDNRSDAERVMSAWGISGMIIADEGILDQEPNPQ